MGLVVIVAVIVWRGRTSGDERAIRGRIEDFRSEINAITTDGLGSAVRAAKIGSFFTENGTVELGEGSPPIHGRETLMGMAARLQPRTAAFRMDLDDIGVELAPGGAAADVTLTASFIRRSMSTGEESRDAREYALVFVKAGGTWQISKITAIDTLH